MLVVSISLLVPRQEFLRGIRVCTLTVNMKMINIRNDQQSRILDNVRQNDPVIRKQDEVTLDRGCKQ